MSCSVGGPSKVIFAPLALASSSAPFLTACQNWCWKPLDTIAMYGCSPPPPPPLGVDDEPVSLPLSEPQAATPMASAAATTANHLLDLMTLSPCCSCSARPLARHVGVDGDKDHDPEDHVLPFL